MQVDVFLANEQELDVDEARLTSLARHVLVAEEVDDNAELSVLCVTSSHMRQLNSHFAGDDYATDVLAFPMGEDDDGALLLGDVVICPDVARRHADERGSTLNDELETLVVHGTLHLLGYEHQGEDDKRQMDGRLHEVLRSFKPYRH